jgi:hypothetical protein
MSLAKTYACVPIRAKEKKEKREKGKKKRGGRIGHHHACLTTIVR